MDVNASIHYQDILPALGVEVNAAPALTTCPICRSHSLWMSSDYLGGYWYSCSAERCQFAGDSIQLYAVARKITIEHAVSEIVAKSPACKLSKLITRSKLDDYRHMLKRSRMDVNVFWRACQEHVLRGHGTTPDGQWLLRNYRLDRQADKPDWTLQMGNRAGLAMVKDVNAMVSEPLSGNPAKIVLVTPMFDLPGRISGLAVMDQYGGEFRWSANRIVGSRIDGLSFMHVLNLFNEEVFAIGNTAWAMAMHSWAANDLQVPLPIIGYSGYSADAWGAFKAKRLIFWEPEESGMVFNIARQLRIPEILIASGPRPKSTDPYEGNNPWPPPTWVR